MKSTPTILASILLMAGSVMNLYALPRQQGGQGGGGMTQLVDCDSSFNGTSEATVQVVLCVNNPPASNETLLEFANAAKNEEAEQDFKCKHCPGGAGRCSRSLVVSDFIGLSQYPQPPPAHAM